MPIMKYSEFNAGIDKWFSIRNGAIGVIDTKLKAYERAPDNRSTLLELQAAVNAFKDEKDNKFRASGGTYKDSKRDKNGTITTLSQQVNAEVDASAPSRPIGLTGLGGIAVAAQTRALARQARAEQDSVDISVAVTQELDYRDGGGARQFGWNVQLKMIERPTELVVKVAVKLNESVPVVHDYKSLWKTQIQGIWNGAALLVPNGSAVRALPIRFELDWYPVGYAGPAYVVNVHKPPAQPKQGEYTKEASGGWAKNQRGPTVGTNVGTPDMGNWGADDSAAIVHEFGHMIGCPDEYYTRKFNGAVMASDTYDQVPFTTNSIMNNTGPGGRIHARHYYLIKTEYERWKGLTVDSIKIQIS